MRTRAPTLWRYSELLPVRNADNVVTLGEGMTPLIPLERIGRTSGLPNLVMKDEGTIPSGTFKARGASVGVSRAKELGVAGFAMSTNGNAGGAWATYAAAAGMRALIVMPDEAPRLPRAECLAAGATLRVVDGLIGDAGRMVASLVSRSDWFDASTLKEPYRIEGKKTMGFELAEQFGWAPLPDVIIYPAGGGVGLIGIYKALLEMEELGWIRRPFPRLVAVQASGCAPIVRAWEGGEAESTRWQNPETVAYGINVAKALGDFLVLEAIRATEGCAIAVDDGEIIEAHRTLGRHGLFVCPEGAATLVAAERLRQSGWLAEADRVLLLNTGSGLKYADLIDAEPHVMAADEELDAPPLGTAA